MASERFDERDARDWKEQSSNRGIMRRSIMKAKARIGLYANEKEDGVL